MRKLTVTCLMALSISGPAFAQTANDLSVPEGSFCIVNASDQKLFFVTENREGARNYSNLTHGERLCSEPTQAEDGIVSVFQSQNSLEGCSRIIKTGVSEDMLAYAEFDRCGWQSHNN